MDTLKKIGIVATLAAPFALGVSKEAAAQTPSIPPDTPSATIAASNDFNPYEDPTRYEQSQTDFYIDDQAETMPEDDWSLVATTGLGLVAIGGVVGATVWLSNKSKANNAARTAEHEHAIPMGPEDDPAFWPPRVD